MFRERRPDGFGDVRHPSTVERSLCTSFVEAIRILRAFNTMPAATIYHEDHKMNLLGAEDLKRILTYNMMDLSDILVQHCFFIRLILISDVLSGTKDGRLKRSRWWGLGERDQST